MKQLFLTSSVYLVARDIAKKVNLAKGNKLMFIDTAAEVEKGDKTWLRDDRQSLVEVGFNVSDYTISGKTKNQLASQLAKFDYIYLSGGNTFYLLEQSLKTGFIPVIKDLVENKGKTYISTSAGSIIAGPKLPKYLIELDYLGETGFNNTAYGLVNFTLLPHWGSEDFKKKYLGNRLELIYKKDQIPLLLLTDRQYVWVKEDAIKIVDVGNNYD